MPYEQVLSVWPLFHQWIPLSFEEDPDPTFASDSGILFLHQSDANLRSLVYRPSIESVCSPLWLHFELPHLMSFDFDADPNPAVVSDVEPDPQQCFFIT